MKNEYVYIVILLFLAILPLGIFADGDATLGTPSIVIADGTGIIANGTGLAVSQPGFINIEIPAGVTVEQVLLYWAGRGAPDDTIVVNGTEVTGTKIGEELPPTHPEATGFRYDITGMGLVSAGMVNTLNITGSSFGSRSDGASVLVIIDDGVSSSSISILDGMDWAWIFGSTPQLQNTVPQTFNFPAAAVDRTGNLVLIMGDGTPDRSDEFEITVDGTTTVLSNAAKGRDGPEWDTIQIDVNIPAGETSVTVQIFSRGPNDPDSLSWVAAALSVPEPQPPSSCDDGKPFQLVFKYTGDGCGATTNSQSGKVTCSGNPGGASPVQIIAIASNGLTDRPRNLARQYSTSESKHSYVML
jgi:hypothetical protein